MGRINDSNNLREITVVQKIIFLFLFTHEGASNYIDDCDEKRKAGLIDVQAFSNQIIF